MSEQIYKPKSCAFHPKEQIFNFCKNAECLLPLCPSCVTVHTEEHKQDNSYGKFQNMTNVVNDLDAFFLQTVKELNCCSEDIKEHAIARQKDQVDIKKRIVEAKTKMIVLVERFFTDFEKEVTKSILAYNDSIKENYAKVQDHINNLRVEINEKSALLATDKVLKTVIGFHAKEDEKKYIEEVQSIQMRLDELVEQKVEVVCQPSAAQKVIDELGNYIHLSFQNWENEIKYVAEFVKTGFTDYHSNSNSNSLRT